MARMIGVQERPAGPAWWAVSGALLVALALAGAKPALSQTAEEEPAPERPVVEANEAGAETVRCILPATIDRLGQQLTTIGPQQRIETTREACAERGGEIAEGDGADEGSR